MPRKAKQNGGGKNPDRNGGGKGLKEQKVQAPKSQSSITEFGAAAMHTTNKGIRIKHSELVGSINGSTGFSTKVLLVNPGLLESFPWLAAMGNSFETFKVHSLRVRYVPRVSANTAGLVLLSAEYNTGDPTAVSGPTSENQMSTTPGAIECPVWASATFHVDPTRFVYQKYFTRLTRVEDLELYDPVVIYYATSGMADTSSVGRLYVEYDIELMTPQFIHSTATVSTKTSTFSPIAGQIITVPNNGEIQYFSHYNPLGITLTSFTKFKFPPGPYMVDLRLNFVVPASSAGCKGEFHILKNGVSMSLDPQFDWSTSSQDLVLSALVSATINQTISVSGVIPVTSSADEYSFYYVAVGTTAGGHVLAAGGSCLTITVA